MSGYTSLFMFWLGGNLGAGTSVPEAAVVGAILIYPAVGADLGIDVALDVLGASVAFSLGGGILPAGPAVDAACAVVPGVSGKPRRR